MIWLILLGMVDYNVAYKVAFKKAHQMGIEAPLQRVIKAYDLHDASSAYLFVFGEEPIEQYIDNHEDWGNNRFLTVVVSAQEYNQPILEVSPALPPGIVNFDEAEKRLKRIVGGDVYFEKYVYMGHIDHWLRFRDDFNRVWYVNAYTMDILSQEGINKLFNFSQVNVEFPVHPGWSLIDEVTFVARDSGYVDSVPFCFWSYGCSPTASAMIMWYWDPRGFGRLVDFYFDRHDNVQGDYDENVPNVQRELAIAMHTDTLTGATSSSYIALGQCRVAQENNYSGFICPSYPPAGASQNWYWDVIVEEIDSQRPTHWAVLNYWYNQPGHSVCAVGYLVDDDWDSLVIVHNTWNSIEEQWALHTSHQGGTSSSAVYPVIPGDSVEDNIFIEDFPKGPFIPGVEYPISWNYTGTQVTHLKLKFVEAEKPENITEVATFDSPAEKKGWWKISITNKEGRFMLQSYNRSSLLAADAIFKKVEVKDVPEKGKFTIVSHLNWNKFIRSIKIGNYLIGVSSYGLYLFDIADAKHPNKKGFYEYSCSPAIVYFNGYLFVGNSNKKLGAFQIKDEKFIKVKEWNTHGKPIGLVITGDKYLVSAEQSTGIVVYDISDISNPQEVSFLELTQIYSVEKEEDNLYVALKREGIGVVDISNPLSPQLKNTFSINEYAILHAVPWKNVIYVAMGNEGLGVVDKSSGSLVKQIELEEGSASRIFVTSKNYLLLSSKAGGLLLYNVSSPTSPSYITKFVGFSYSEDAIPIGSNAIALSNSTDGIYFLQTSFEISSVEDVCLEGIKIEKMFNNSFSIVVDRPMKVEFKVYSADGRIVYGDFYELPTGAHILKIKKRLAKGVYFVKLNLLSTQGNKVIDKNFKIVVLK